MQDANDVLSTTLIFCIRQLAHLIGIPIISQLVSEFDDEFYNNPEQCYHCSSIPYIDVSTVSCLFEYYLIGMLLSNSNKMPVTDLLVIWSCAAWSAST